MTDEHALDDLERRYEIPKGFSWASPGERSADADRWRLVAEGSAHPDWNADGICVYQSIAGDRERVFVARLFVTPGPDSEVSIEESSKHHSLDQLFSEIEPWTEPLRSIL